MTITAQEPTDDHTSASVRPVNWTVAVDRSALSRGLLLTIGALLVLSTLGQIARCRFGWGSLFGLVRLFYVDAERNVPPFFSVLLLLLAAALLAVVAATMRRRSDRFWRYWGGLAVLFAGLAADEFIGFHEMPIEHLRRLLGAHGLLYFTWVIPGMGFVALVAILWTRWLLALPVETRNRYVVAGVIFVSGAIGVEMLSGWAAEYRGEDSGLYAAIVTVEEACEMLGVWYFIDATLRLLQRLDVAFVIRFGPRNTACGAIANPARGAEDAAQGETSAAGSPPAGTPVDPADGVLHEVRALRNLLEQDATPTRDVPTVVHEPDRPSGNRSDSARPGAAGGEGRPAARFGPSAR